MYLVYLSPPPRRLYFPWHFVCLVCLSVSHKNYRWDLRENFTRTKKNWLNFGTHLHLVWIQEFWKILQHWEIPRAFFYSLAFISGKIYWVFVKILSCIQWLFLYLLFCFTLKFVICIQSCACIHHVYVCNAGEWNCMCYTSANNRHIRELSTVCAYLAAFLLMVFYYLMHVILDCLFWWERFWKIIWSRVFTAFYQVNSTDHHIMCSVTKYWNRPGIKPQ